MVLTQSTLETNNKLLSPLHGVEPSTPETTKKQSWWSLSGPATPACKVGGAYRDRTDDPLLAKQVLSQLS